VKDTVEIMIAGEIVYVPIAASHGGGHKASSHKQSATHKAFLHFAHPKKTHAKKPEGLTKLKTHFKTMRGYHREEADYHAKKIEDLQQHLHDADTVYKDDYKDAIAHHTNSLKYHRRKAKSFLSRGKNMLSRLFNWLH